MPVCTISIICLLFTQLYSYSEILVQVTDSSRQRSFSVGANNRTKSSLLPYDNRTTQLWTSHSDVVPSAVVQCKQRIAKQSLCLSMRELASMDDVSGRASGILFAFNVCEQDSEDHASSNDDPSWGTGIENGQNFNWRLVGNPWSLILGLGIVVYSSGMAVTYQCLPPLAKAAGTYIPNTQTNIHQH